MTLVVMNGGFVFVADLIRAIVAEGTPLNVNFIKLSSYWLTTKSSGKISVDSDIPENFSGKSVLIVDDIIDTGRTIMFARELVLSRNAREVKTCVLLDKPWKRSEDVKLDYVGFEIGDFL